MEGRTRSELEQAIELTSADTVDRSIARMAARRLSDVVMISEGMRFQIGMVGKGNAADFLVARLFTDAVFSDDIRSIQLIINRIDGGLPKDTEVEDYQTAFGDALNEVMGMPADLIRRPQPDDTVMMALCKNLYLMAIQDIYWDHGADRPRRPSEAAKKERDAALRMVLERTGGRKTLTDVPRKSEEIEVAPWIAELSAHASRDAGDVV